MHFLGFLLFGLLLLRRGFSCVISGTDSGTCSKRYLPSTYDVRAIETARSLWDCEGRDCLPFCGKFVASYEICLPKSDGVPLPPDQNFPHGRFHHTTSTYYKDSWVKKTALETIANKQDLFAANLDCQEAYERRTRRGSSSKVVSGRGEGGGDVRIYLCYMYESQFPPFQIPAIQNQPYFLERIDRASGCVRVEPYPVGCRQAHVD